MKKDPRHLDIGDLVNWIEPDEGVCSHEHRIIDILSDTKRVEDDDTILVLQSESGSVAEALISEISLIGA